MFNKQQPPRPGLVPQSGDPRHPKHWIRPDREFGKPIPNNEDPFGFRDKSDEVVKRIGQWAWEHAGRHPEDQSAKDYYKAAMKELDRREREVAKTHAMATTTPKFKEPTQQVRPPKKKLVGRPQIPTLPGR